MGQLWFSNKDAIDLVLVNMQILASTALQAGDTELANDLQRLYEQKLARHGINPSLLPSGIIAI